MDGINSSAHQISDAGLYTDFSGLQKLRSKVSNANSSQSSTAESIPESRAANKEVAKQFESLYLQMMLKSMRDATITGESSESDQTQFYQEMFDKQIALDLTNNKTGAGLGIAAMLEKDLNGGQAVNNQAENNQAENNNESSVNSIELIRNQIELSRNHHLQSNGSAIDTNSTVDKQE
jgi:Rod binding domain-containing protein